MEFEISSDNMEALHFILEEIQQAQRSPYCVGGTIMLRYGRTQARVWKILVTIRYVTSDAMANDAVVMLR
jgi:hypothetical protein